MWDSREKGEPDVRTLTRRDFVKGTLAGGLALTQLRQFGDSEKNLRSHFSRFVSVWPPEASLTRNYTALPVAIPM